MTLKKLAVTVLLCAAAAICLFYLMILVRSYL